MKSLNSKLFIAGCVLTHSASILAQDVKPNILWIITDDQRADALECWNRATRGNSESELGYVMSPNVDKLAKEGVLFTRSFCNSPVSAPSRASIHTGRYPHHNGIPDFRLTHNTNDFAKPLFPTVLKNEGYKTTNFGKLGTRISDYGKELSFKTINIYESEVTYNSLQEAGMTDWGKSVISTPKEKKGKTEFWIYEDGTRVSYYRDRPNGLEIPQEDIKTRLAFDKKQQIIRKGGTGVYGGESPQPTHKTLDGRIQESFIKYLRNENKEFIALNGKTMQGANTSQPQFINLGFHFPHTAVIPSKEYRDIFKSKKYKVPQLTNEEWEKMPAQIKTWQKSGSIAEFTPQQKEQMIRDYYAFCAMGDMLIGEAVAEFKAYCKRNKQPYYIVYACGDHGWHLGEQGVSCKSSGYVKSNQTAVIVVSSEDNDRVPKGRIVDDLVEYVDFYPTFISMAGVDEKSEAYKFLDGRSLIETISGEVKGRDYVLGETNVVCGPRGYLRSIDFAFSMQIREEAPSKSYPGGKNIKWALEAPREDVSMALFDLRVDPNEQNNVANDPKYAALADWFRVKTANIIVGDNRVEVTDWKVKNDYYISDFAVGSDDKKLNIPEKLIPNI